MPTPDHVPWNIGDPKYSGAFDKQLIQDFAIAAGGQLDLDIDAAHICLIYKLVITAGSANAWRFKLYEKAARAAGDLLFDSESQTGDWTYIQTKTQVPIIYVDLDGTNDLHATMEGTNGDTHEVDMRMVRLT